MLSNLSWCRRSLFGAQEARLARGHQTPRAPADGAQIRQRWASGTSATQLQCIAPPGLLAGKKAANPQGRAHVHFALLVFCFLRSLRLGVAGGTSGPGRGPTEQTSLTSAGPANVCETCSPNVHRIAVGGRVSFRSCSAALHGAGLHILLGNFSSNATAARLMSHRQCNNRKVLLVCRHCFQQPLPAGMCCSTNGFFRRWSLKTAPAAGKEASTWELARPSGLLKFLIQILMCFACFSAWRLRSCRGSISCTHSSEKGEAKT